MIRRPPRSTRTDSPFPYTTLFRSKTPCALADDLVDFRLRNAAEIARNDVVRMREAGFRVRIVRRPHDVAAARFVAQQDADAVVDERAVDIAIHVEARLLGQRTVGPVALLFPEIGRAHV